MAAIIYYRRTATAGKGGRPRCKPPIKENEYIVLLNHTPDRSDILMHKATGFECIHQVFIPFDLPDMLPMNRVLIPRVQR